MKGWIRRELERLDLLARQIKQVEAERDALAVVPKTVLSPCRLVLVLRAQAAGQIAT
jgi:hypothetical protein